jgi:hypothetical protein
MLATGAIPDDGTVIVQGILQSRFSDGLGAMMIWILGRLVSVELKLQLDDILFTQMQIEPEPIGVTRQHFRALHESCSRSQSLGGKVQGYHRHVNKSMYDSMFCSVLYETRKLTRKRR